MPPLTPRREPEQKGWREVQGERQRKRRGDGAEAREDGGGGGGGRKRKRRWSGTGGKNEEFKG